MFNSIRSHILFILPSGVERMREVEKNRELKMAVYYVCSRQAPTIFHQISHIHAHTHSQTEYNQIRIWYVYLLLSSITTHKTKLIYGAVRCASVRIQSCVLWWIIHYTLRMSAWKFIQLNEQIWNWILYHMWKPLYNNKNRWYTHTHTHRENVCYALTTVCMLDCRVWRSLSQTTIKWHRRTSRS